MNIPSVNLSSIISIGLAHPSGDLFLGALFVVVSLIYAISFGRNRAVIALVSIYMGFSATLVFPLERFKLADILLEGFYLKLTIFAFFTILAFLLFSTSFLQKIFGYARARGGTWWQIVLCSFVHIGLLSMIILSFLAEGELSNFSPTVILLFTTGWAKFIWIALPILALFFLRQESY